MPKCVSAKFVCKSIYDKAQGPVALKQMKETVQKTVNDEKPKLEYKDSCKEGWLLTVTLDSLTVDDPSKPNSIEAKVTVVGVAVGGTASGFKANGSSKATGLNAKKMDEEVKFIVNDALGKLMTGKVIPAM